MFKNIAIALLVAILVIVAWNPVIAPAGRTIGRAASAGWQAAWNDPAAPDAPAPVAAASVTDNPTPAVAPEAPEAEAEAPAVATSDGEFISGESRTVNGPAIVQLWDGKTVPGCGIYQIPAGYRLTWALRGHWWLFEGVKEDAFNAEFDRSAEAYTASNPQCTMVAPTLK